MSTTAASKHSPISRKASLFTESVIREMTREALKYGAVNLSQGFPDFPAPEDIKQVAMQAIADDLNQYAITWGDRSGNRNYRHLRFDRRNDRGHDGDRRQGRRSNCVRTVL